MGRKILLTVLQRGASSSALADARNVHSPQLIHDFDSARSLENRLGSGWHLRFGGIEGVYSGDRLAQDQRVDVVGTLVSLH
jgi:hypothetical protein